jgi:hypothetical protein
MFSNIRYPFWEIYHGNSRLFGCGAINLLEMTFLYKFTKLITLFKLRTFSFSHKNNNLMHFPHIENFEMGLQNSGFVGKDPQDLCTNKSQRTRPRTAIKLV